jgi:hypothetical protein
MIAQLPPRPPAHYYCKTRRGVVAGGIPETRMAAGGWVGQGAQHGTLLVGSEATPRARRAPVWLSAAPADNQARTFESAAQTCLCALWCSGKML